MINSSKLVAIGLLLTGCISSPDIQDQSLSDRVKACSAGFSTRLQTSLGASLDKSNLKGGVNADFKEETKGIIFSEIPEQDRHAVYEDYIGCIEKNWNN